MFTLNCRGRLLVIDRPIVMGILNFTPDSFYAGSRVSNEEHLFETVSAMLRDGASIIDIGGQSTRPGSERLSPAEETDRIMPGIEFILKHFPDALLSIDTFHAAVARQTVEAGVSIINDISGGTMDPDMLAVTASLRVPYICMHLKGTPQTMQQLAHYDNVSLELLDFFIQRIAQCQEAGILDIIVDPGFGFAKTIRHNFEILRNLEIFQMLQRPILAGLSRKSTVYKTLGTTPDKALNGSTVLHTLALQNGASILRVHDVREAWETIRLFEAYKS